MAAPVLDAVTALLLHGDELFLVQRSAAMPAFPGYQAFPGGKVDAADAAYAPGALLDAHPAAQVGALARELAEELGFDLPAAIAAGEVVSVQCLGQATTPHWAPLRFRTWFYKVVLRHKPDFALDPGEAASGHWRRVGDWLALYRSGRVLMAPPTLIATQALDADLHVAALPRLDIEFRDDGTSIPVLEPLGGLKILLVRSNTLPPAIHTNVFWFGGDGSPRVLVDPSPANREELEKLCRRVDELGIDLVFLTHHHPDHREFADEIARRYGVPLALSGDTRARITAKAGPAYFEGLDVREMLEGDELTRWQGEPVRLVSVPGHDEGQLAPMPDSRAWCIVGDLMQGIGTVVIAPPEGDMRKYFATLKKVIALDPAVIVPSHGMALGGTHYLRKALAHREQREAQILERHRAGLSEDQILDEVYRGTPPPLMPLARINIRSHMAKLREEGVLS